MELNHDCGLIRVARPPGLPSSALFTLQVHYRVHPQKLNSTVVLGHTMTKTIQINYPKHGDDLHNLARYFGVLFLEPLYNQLIHQKHQNLV